MSVNEMYWRPPQRLTAGPDPCRQLQGRDVCTTNGRVFDIRCVSSVFCLFDDFIGFVIKEVYSMKAKDVGLIVAVKFSVIVKLLTFSVKLHL